MWHIYDRNSWYLPPVKISYLNFKEHIVYFSYDEQWLPIYVSTILLICVSNCVCVLWFLFTLYVTFIEQKGECIIRYFGRPCDEFAERVWPIKISDGARVTLFNKGLVSCDVNQRFLILLFEWAYVSFMMTSCIFWYRRYCMMWRHLAPSPLLVS